LTSCTHCCPVGAFSTSFESWGAIQRGMGMGSNMVDAPAVATRNWMIGEPARFGLISPRPRFNARSDHFAPTSEARTASVSSQNDCWVINGECIEWQIAGVGRTAAKCGTTGVQARACTRRLLSEETFTRRCLELRSPPGGFAGRRVSLQKRGESRWTGYKPISWSETAIPRLAPDSFGYSTTKSGLRRTGRDKL
jgi:hypothetical protein